MEVTSTNLGRAETVYTPAAPSLTVGRPIIDFRAGLHQSTDPLEGANVELRSGWEWQPPPCSTPPSTSNPTPPVTSFLGGPPVEFQSHGVDLSVPIINTAYASIVTYNANGTTTVDENSSTTTAADLSKYTSDTSPSLATSGANSTVAVSTGNGAFASATASQPKTIDVTA